MRRLVRGDSGAEPRPAAGATTGLSRFDWAIGGFLLALATIAVFEPLLPLPDPNQQELVARLASPVGFGGAWDHPLGTDGLGRDLLARIVAGTRVTLLLAVGATLAAGAIGVALGLLSGTLGRVIDRLVEWITDLAQALPFVVVAIALAAATRPGAGTVLLTLAATGWVPYARVVRLQARVVRRAPFVEAAHALGASRQRVVLRHILPNLLGPIFVIGSQQMGAMVLYEAALSYLGLGVSGETVTWGGMVAAGQDALFEAWWMATMPGVAIALTAFCLNLLGDRLAAGTGRR